MKLKSHTQVQAWTNSTTSPITFSQELVDPLDVILRRRLRLTSARDFREEWSIAELADVNARVSRVRGCPRVTAKQLFILETDRVAGVMARVSGEGIAEFGREHAVPVDVVGWVGRWIRCLLKEILCLRGGGYAGGEGEQES